MLRAKALVAPSLGGESFGIVLVRPLACATPVVASDIPGCQELIDSGTNGVLHAPGDVVSLCASLETLQDPAVRNAYAAAAREKVVQHFSAAAMARSYTDLYQTLVH